jgi:hypothetical protein
MEGMGKLKKEKKKSIVPPVYHIHVALLKKIKSLLCHSISFNPIKKKKKVHCATSIYIV